MLLGEMSGSQEWAIQQGLEWIPVLVNLGLITIEKY